MPKNIFITGATGYIGTKLIPELLSAKHRLSCLVRTPEKLPPSHPLHQCKLIKGDLNNTDLLSQAAMQQDAVIHLAVLGHVNEKGTTYERYHQANVIGTQNLLDACIQAQAPRIICCSSTAAIGLPDGNTINEQTPLNPSTPYGKSKKAADELILKYVRDEGVPAILLAFPHVFGPGDIRDFLKIVRLIKKGILPQIGFKPNYFPACYLTDAAKAIILALTHGNVGEKYMIADHDPHDMRDIRKCVRQELGISTRLPYPVVPKGIAHLLAKGIETLFTKRGKVPPIRTSNIENLALSRRIDSSKAQKELNFKHHTTLPTAIAEIMQWYRDNGYL